MATAFKCDHCEKFSNGPATVEITAIGRIINGVLQENFDVCSTECGIAALQRLKTIADAAKAVRS